MEFPNTPIRIAYGGDRQIGVDILDLILSDGVRPLALLLPAQGKGSHSVELLSRCRHLDPATIWYGTGFRTSDGLQQLRLLNLDYIICVHLPVIMPSSVLEIPRHGVLNLHPAFLPYNRGWHNPVWAMLDGTPYGGTLHFMSEEIDAGDIVHQAMVHVKPSDTADTLYQRALRCEYDVFKEAWPSIMNRSYARKAQQGQGTVHKKRDLAASNVQYIDLDAWVRAGDIITKLRALSTNHINEAGYYVINGRRYYIHVSITEEQTARDA